MHDRPTTNTNTDREEVAAADQRAWITLALVTAAFCAGYLCAIAGPV